MLTFLSPAVLFWVAALIIFLVVEAATVGLVSICFAGGALAGLIAAAFGCTHLASGSAVSGCLCHTSGIAPASCTGLDRTSENRNQCRSPFWKVRAGDRGDQQPA